MRKCGITGLILLFGIAINGLAYAFDDTKKDKVLSEPSNTAIIKKDIPPRNSAQAKELIPPANDITSSLVQVTLGLFVVLVVIAGAAWLTRRFGKFNVTAKGNLRILAGLHMGSREKVVLMQVGEQQLLLGVTPGRIQTLHVLDSPIAIEGNENNGVESPLSKFSQIFGQVRQK